MNPSLSTLSFRRALQTAWHSRFMAAGVAFLLAVFLFAKTAGLIHEEVHPFHHHSDTCDIYQALAHPASDDVYELEVALSKPEYEHQDSVVVSQQLTNAYPAFWGRAPPSFV